jgi:hypothetical protein
LLYWYKSTDADGAQPGEEQVLLLLLQAMTELMLAYADVC